MAATFSFASSPAPAASALLVRVEEAGLNASAPPQQLLYDGWLVRFSPGKAKRARCVNALAAGHLPLQEKLDYLEQLYAQHKLPAFIRITPFTQPPDLDAQLAAQGWHKVDDTRVMVADLTPYLEHDHGTQLPPHRVGRVGEGFGHGAAVQTQGTPNPLPTSPSRLGEESSTAPQSDHARSMRLLGQNALETRMDIGQTGLKLERPSVTEYADIVGTLRGSPAEQRRAHAQRLAASPVPFEPFALNDARGVAVACGQIAREGAFVGVYDVFVRQNARGQGFAAALTATMLQEAIKQGARTAYLQVDADNAAARAVYTKFGFADAYGYWYRAVDANAA